VPDETLIFLTPDQIVEDIASRIDEDSGKAIACDFEPHPDAGQSERFAIRYGKSMCMRRIRNVYHLWDTRNPHVVLSPPPNKDGIIDHPLFPDNVSAAIYDALRAKMKEKYPDATHCPRLDFDTKGG